MDWFLYDNGLRHERVKDMSSLKTIALQKLEEQFIELIEYANKYYDVAKFNTTVQRFFNYMKIVKTDRRSRLNEKNLEALLWIKVEYPSDSNGIRTHSHLVCKRTLNHIAKLAKWLSCVVSAYLYGAFDSMLLSCHVRVSEWIYTL